MAKALFNKEVKRRVQEEKERHRLIDSEVQHQMTDIILLSKRSAHMSVPSSGKYHSLSYVFFLLEALNN